MLPTFRSWTVLFTTFAFILIFFVLFCSLNANAQQNRPPIAVDDNYSGTAARYQRAPGVLANDSNPDGGGLSASLVTPPANGTLYLYGDGMFQYRPADGFTGTDTFVYKACKTATLCSTATVTLRANNAPNVSNDSYVGRAARQQKAPGVLANDTDPENDSMNTYIVTAPANGTVSLDAYGAFQYRPANGFTGTDSFTYKACDGYKACSTATVSVQANDAPTPKDDIFSILNGKVSPSTGFYLLPNDTDPNGDGLYAELVSQPAHGSAGVYSHGYFLYTPAANYSGIDSFVYRACDDYKACTNARVFFIIEGKDQNAGATSCEYPRPDPSVAHPVNTTNGNMWLQQMDYNLSSSIGESINFTRTYNSIVQIPGLFGKGWSTQYDENITAIDNYSLRLSLADGRAVYFGRRDTNAQFISITPDFFGKLVKNADSSYTVTFKDSRIHKFNAAGKLTALIDRQGNQTTLNYDANNRLISIVDSFDRTVDATIDTAGRIIALNDNVGQIATYDYGASGELRFVNYPDNSKYQFDYTTVGNQLLLTTVKDALGNILEHHAYDGYGRATTSERQGGVEKYTFNYVSSTETRVTDALNRVSKFFFKNIRGRNVVEKIEGICGCGASNQVQTWEYDNQLNVTKKTDANLNVTTFTYDANGNRLSATDVLGTERFTYNSFGEVLTHTDRMNGVTANTFDAAGNLLTTKNALDKTTTFTYTQFGQLETVKDARNNTTTLSYDQFGRLKTIKDADDKTTNYDYDARSRVTSVRNALLEETQFEYDAVNRIKKVIFPDTKSVTYNYDPAGRRTGITDARGHTTAFEYDSAYRLTKVTDELNHATSFGYDLMSNRTSIIDPVGSKTNYEYDDFNRLKKVVYPAAQAGAVRLYEEMEYDAAGNLKKRIDTALRATSYEYDAANRLRKTIDVDAKETRFEYNERSQPTAVIDALGQRYEFTYDPLGRVLSQTRAGLTMNFEYDAVGSRTKRVDYNNVTTSYTYDGLNRLKTIVYPNQSENVSFLYDDLSRVKSATNQNGALTFNYDNRGRLESTVNQFGQTVRYNFDENGNRTALLINNAAYASYGYDSANRLKQIVAASDNAQIDFNYDDANKLTSKLLPNNVASSYQYDGLSRINRLTDVSNNTQLYDRNYAYNTASQISQIAELSATRDFSYDNLDRLKNVAAANGANENYQFDPVGNRTASHLSANYTHEAFNRLKNTNSATFTYDNNGNMQSKTDSSGMWHYEWDYENRMKKATRPDGQFVTYKYDALGRRIERSQSSGEWTKFNYDGADVILDQNSNGTNVSYLNGPGIDNKLRQVVDNQAQYFITDHLGSTNALIDSNGNVVSQTAYDSFGNQTNSLATRYGYTGRERDDFTGLMYNRARWYSPELGRFISEDPIRFNGGDINLFVYVKNNSLHYKDPNGTNPLKAVWNWYKSATECGKTGIESKQKCELEDGGSGSIRFAERQARNMASGKPTYSSPGAENFFEFFGKNENCQESLQDAADVFESSFPLGPDQVKLRKKPEEAPNQYWKWLKDLVGLR